MYILSIFLNFAIKKSNIFNCSYEKHRKLTQVNINNSKIEETNFELFPNKILNSKIGVNNINGTFYKYGADIDNSSINIYGNILNNKVLSNINFKNNSQIILNKYNNKVKIYNQNSILDKDYRVQYLGNDELLE